VRTFRSTGAPLVVAAALTVTLLVAGSTGSAPAAPADAVAVGSWVGSADALPHRATPTRPVALPHWCSGAARACVDTHRRTAWLVDSGDVRRGPVPVALGRPGHRTPHGRFHVEWKAPDWTSTEYGIPMPWSVFFATGGIAFHAGPLDERSHGCVHLRLRDAKRFFAGLAVGDVVIVR
jgi:hypothetical protein